MKNKTYILLSVFIACAALVFFLYNGNNMNKTDGGTGANPAPPLTVTDSVSGKNIPASEYNGKVIFVNFWASWCQPCKEEMPSIEALFREMSSSDKFKMVTILYKDSPSSAFEYMKSQGYTFPVYVDTDGATARQFGVTGVPETYIIDRKGNLVKKVIGGLDSNSPEFKSFLNSLLK
jgi:cytochrome c biogenesis protein CcmG/thiol:disulfide interchange protein DsbE